MQGPLNGSGPPPSWRELTRLARCARGANQTVMVRCGRLGAIQAAAPTVFRYCCARGIQNPPAAPAKKLQWFETPRLLRRLDSVCSGVAQAKSQSAMWPYLTQGRTRCMGTKVSPCPLVWGGATIRNRRSGRTGGRSSSGAKFPPASRCSTCFDFPYTMSNFRVHTH